MIEQNEIINVKSWMSLGDCNYEIDHDDDSIPESGVVYCNIEHIHKFFAKCEKTTNKYVVISAFSDYGLAIQKEHPVSMDMRKWLPFVDQMITPEMGYAPIQLPPRCEIERCDLGDKYSIKCYSHTYSTVPSIPNNIVKWYLTNSMTRNKTIESIPLGVGKDAAPDICSTVSDPLVANRSDRVNLMYINWQDNTIERANIKNAYSTLNPDWVTIVHTPKPYTQYLKDLSSHTFALCPQGNGVDCYRVLECLYCGCIPIVKDEIAYDYLRGLPHIRVNQWNQINPDFLKENLNIIQNTGYNKDALKLSFWKNKIEESRGLLL